MNDTKFNKKTGYKMADRQVGYRGEKFSKKCFQRQLKESLSNGVKKMTVEELRGCEMKEIPFKQAQDFILKYEWLGTMGTTKFSLGLFNREKLVAVYCFGLTAGTQVLSEPFGSEFKKDGIVLVRGACSPESHKHTGSFGLKKACEVLKNKGYKFVIAYSDLEAGEIGTIYQACNWVLYGTTSAVTYLVRPDGKRVDPKLIHKYAKKNNITRQQQLDIFNKEGYTLEKGSPKLKYIQFIGSKKQKKAIKRKLRRPSLPYPKRADDMKGVLKQTISNYKAELKKVN